MFHWLHHLFVPHCDLCRQEKLEEKECPNCIILKQLLETEKFENKQLLDRILYIPEVAQEEHKPLPEPIRNNAVSIRMRREMLEKQDRIKAEVMRKKEIETAEASSTEDLEKELLNKEVV